jgi:hypothetical protein
MKRLVLVIVNILVFFSFIGAVFLSFWYFGIFKKEVKSSEAINRIESQLNFVSNYSFKDTEQYLKKLPNKVYQLPEVRKEEIGRQSLF